MDRRAFLGTLTGGLLAAPLGAGGQSKGEVRKIGAISLGDPPKRGPDPNPFWEPMRTLGWVEGQNVTVERRGAGGDWSAPLAAVAQQAVKVYRIGYLTSFRLDDPLTQSFRQGLRDLGYVEGRDVIIEGRSADQRPNDLEKLAAELVAAKVDVLVVATGVAALAAKRVTATIPIVMAASADAVTQGIVASLARPGGNVTGMTHLIPEVAPKRLEILKEVLPRLKRTAALWCPEIEISHVELRYSRAAAERLHLQLEPVAYRANASWNAVAEALRLNLPDALVIFNCPALPDDAVVDWALKHRLPTISAYASTTLSGGLLSYGTDLYAMPRRAAVFVDKILKGARPADLPIEQPTKFELVINLKTAKALGLTIPQSLLQRADQVIE